MRFLQNTTLLGGGKLLALRASVNGLTNSPSVLYGAPYPSHQLLALRASVNGLTNSPSVLCGAPYPSYQPPANVTENAPCLFSPRRKGASPSPSLSVLYCVSKCKGLLETTHWFIRHILLLRIFCVKEKSANFAFTHWVSPW